MSYLEKGFLSSVDPGAGFERGGGALLRHGNRVRLDLWVAAETQQGGAEYLGGIASQSKIAQAGCDDGAFEGKCPIANVPVFGLRGDRVLSRGQTNESLNLILTDVAEHSSCRALTKVASPKLANALSVSRMPCRG